jgi:hypothetical protein
MNKFWNREPAMFMATIQAAIALGISFGLDLTGDQVGAIMAFSAAVLGLVTRSQVFPAAKTVQMTEEAAATGKVPAEVSEYRKED